MKVYIFFLTTVAAVTVQSRTSNQYTTPTPILKQINRHNEDGSYSYGYEGADGTYKIETKYPNGEVYGKYGYIDDQGKLREIEYGASRRGFEPAGSEISVPPPTLERNPDASRPLGPDDEDDGQYREDPSVYFKDDRYNRRDPPSPPPRQYDQPAWNDQRSSSWYDQPSWPRSKFNLDEFDSFIQNTTPRPYRPPPPPPPPPTPPAYPQYSPNSNYDHYNNYNPPSYNHYNNYNPPNYNHYNNYNPPSNYNPYNNYNYNHYPANPYVPNIDYYTGSYTVNYRR